MTHISQILLQQRGFGGCFSPQKQAVSPEFSISTTITSRFQKFFFYGFQIGLLKVKEVDAFLLNF